jgi:hypothetical protein
MSKEDRLSIEDTISEEESNNDSIPEELATPLKTN